MTGTLVQLNISNGGMPKLPIESARVKFEGVTGDWSGNRKYHGGPERAICLFSEELYQWLRDEHDIDLKNGSVGENFTTRGIDLQQMMRGDRLRIGKSCVIEIDDVRVPCKNLTQWHPRLHKLIEGHSGWMARVIEEGDVRPGDSVTRLR